MKTKKINATTGVDLTIVKNGFKKSYMVFDRDDIIAKRIPKAIAINIPTATLNRENTVDL